MLLVTIPWIIHNSNTESLIPEINDKTIGNFQSNTCEFSLYEFLKVNNSSQFGINLDKSASVNCFSKINGADIVDDKFIVYLGTNLNIDLIIQSLFWLLLFSFIPKSKNSQSGEIKYKNISNLLICCLLIVHFLSEKDFYNFNSKIFSTNLDGNFLIYSVALTFFIFFKLFIKLYEERTENILYYLPFLFVIPGTFNSSNLNIVFICLILIGTLALFEQNLYKILLVIYFATTYFWISIIDVELAFFDVDKLKGFNSSSYNELSVFFWSISIFLFTLGFVNLCKKSNKNLDLIKMRFNFLLSGSLIVILSIVSALNPFFNFLTYYYLGLNKTASKTFDAVAGNAWRGISSSAESIGEFYAFTILLSVITFLYKKDAKLTKFEVSLILINIYGLIKANNFAAIISSITVLILLSIFFKIKNKRFKYSLSLVCIVFFPLIYFLFFNSYSTEEASRRMLKESFAISNIEYLDTNQFNQNAIDENRFYEVILSNESEDNISSSLNYLVEKYHFSKRNNLPNITSFISYIASPINRSEKWGVFFGKYNPNIQTFLIGTGPNNLVNYYLSHASQSNTGLVLPHSSLFSYLIYFGLIGLILFTLLLIRYLINGKNNKIYLAFVIFYIINLLKSDSLLYLNSYLLFIFILNSNNLFNIKKVGNEK